MPLYLRSAQVQGAGAAEDLARALAEIEALPQVEVIIIGRGGGSLEDLWAFNEEVLVSAIAACTKPVISAVGHESDVTLADFAADVRAATPSAAAELAVPSKAELQQRVLHIDGQLASQAAQQLQRLQVSWQQAQAKLEQYNPTNRLDLLGLKLARVTDRLHAGIQAQIQQKLDVALRLMERFLLSSPKSTLRRGYVIALAEGRPVQSVSQIREELNLLFQDGTARVKVLEINKENDK